MPFFCRQPIFDARARVWGYELLLSTGPVKAVGQGMEAATDLAPMEGGPPHLLEKLAGVSASG